MKMTSGFGIIIIPIKPPRMLYTLAATAPLGDEFYSIYSPGSECEGVGAFDFGFPHDAKGQNANPNN